MPEKKHYPSYPSKQDVLNALAQYPAGDVHRKEILSNDLNRHKVLSSGCSLVLYAGCPQTTQTPECMLSNVFLGLIERLVAKTGKRDGIGNLGGLAERTDKTLFAQMTLSEQTELISQKDDIIQLPSGKICLTTDINIISCHNVQREAKEELQNIGITSNILNFAQMKPVPLYNVKDDNYILNKWNGQGIAYAISPAAYFLPVSETVLDMIVQASHTNIHENQSEVAHFCKIKLTDALTRFGKPTTKAPSLESRDMLSDYRYPHEWLSAWYIASYLLDFNTKKLKELAISLQKKTPYLIDFKSAMQQMGQSTQDMAKTLGINSDDLNDLITETQMQYTLNKQQNLNNISSKKHYKNFERN